MRPVARRPLTKRTTAFLAKRTKAVTSDADSKARAEHLWRSKSNAAFNEIRDALNAMSRGRLRCMYCEDNEATSIDHFWPKAVYPDKAFLWENYLFACSSCNSNYKRDQFPLFPDGSACLIDPASCNPSDHLLLSFTTGKFVELTESGAASVRVFGLQRQTLVDGRRNAYHVVCALLDKLAGFDRTSPVEEVYGVVMALRQISFSSVVYFLVESLELPSPELVLSARLIAQLRENRELLTM